MAAAHRSQILPFQAVSASIHERLAATVALRDLGRVRLKDLSTPEHIYQLVHPSPGERGAPFHRASKSTAGNAGRRMTRINARRGGAVAA